MSIQLWTPLGIFEGWENVRISLGLDQLSGSFEFAVSGANARELSQHPLHKGLECKVLLHGQTVVTGFIGKRRPSYDASSHTLSIAGRDVTCDLIDCSAMLPNQELHNVTIADVATQLIAPFPFIRLDCPDPGAAFAKVTVNDGDTIFSVLESLAKQRGLMIYTTGDGVLHIRRPLINSTGLLLSEGREILSASLEESDNEQFAEYIVRSQQPDTGKTAAEQRYTQRGVRQGRVRIITAEQPDDGQQIKNRAEWEAKLRQARSVSATVKVQSWQKQRGVLWRLGDDVRITSPSLGLRNTAMVVNTIAYSIEDGGTTTELGLVLPEVFVYAQSN